MQALHQGEPLLRREILEEARRLTSFQQRPQVLAVDGPAFGDGAGQVLAARRGPQAQPLAQRIAKTLIGNIDGNIRRAGVLIKLTESADILQRRQPRLRPRQSLRTAAPRERYQHRYRDEGQLSEEPRQLRMRSRRRRGSAITVKIFIPQYPARLAADRTQQEVQIPRLAQACIAQQT